MRIVDTTTARQRLSVTPMRARRAANVELAGLAAATCVVLLGLCLAVWGQLDAAPGERNTGPRLLADLDGPGALAPLLVTIDSDAERLAVAERLMRRIGATDAPIEHVGALATVTMPVREIRSDRRFVQLRTRVESRAPDDVVRVLSSADLAALKARLVVRTAHSYVSRLGRLVLCFFAAFWAAHAVRRLRGASDDPAVLPLLLVLCGVGLMSMIALRDPLRDMIIASTFVGGVCAGLALLLVASEIDWEASPLRRAVLVPLGLALGLAVLLLLFGSGPGTSGVKVNLFGGQPVEAIRLLVVFAVAGALARRFEFLRELSEPATASRPWLRHVALPRWRDVRPVVVSMALVLAFFFLQKDLGPALVLSGVVIALYTVARGRIAFAFVGLAMLVTAFALAYAIGFPATVGQRVRIWVDPWNNGVAGGNQIAHGLWAMATGGGWGSPPGLGRPQVIPEGHTDFVIAALGEQFGLVGVIVVIAAYALLGWRCLRIALRAPGDYSAMLAIGVTLALLVQAAVIAGGLLGVLPLTGVVTPFLSFGRSSMLANCFAVGIVLAIGRRQGPVREPLRRSVRMLATTLAAVALVMVGRAGWVQVVQADTLATAASLSEQGDGGYRFEYNPRLVAAARAIERGTVRDRAGLVLATSRASEMAAVQATYARAGLDRPLTCAPDAPRCYPLGGVAFQVVGDWARQTNWGARNASYLERELDATLKGFDDHQRLVDVVHPRTGERHRVVLRDYSALLPVVRHGADSTRPDVRLLLDRPRDVTSTLDARLQARVGRALQRGIERGAHARGAAVVIDADTGHVLASVSYPWPADVDLAADDERARDAVFDRVRYGVYPPGSTFKLLVAAAALRSRPELQQRGFMCQRLPGGRVGQSIAGWARPVRDDVQDTSPHGASDLQHALVASCNAYFAQLAMAMGPRPLIDAVSMFQIEVARPQSADALRNTLPHAGYGQGDVLASPLKMARVAAAIANDGVAMRPQWTVEAAAPGGERFLSAADARRLAVYMRQAVTSGTGRAVAGNATPIAGKTGTAEVQGRPSHSWFVGIAPHGGPRRLAFAVLIEHAGYGGRAAAPVAGEIVDAARELGLFTRQ